MSEIQLQYLEKGKTAYISESPIVGYKEITNMHLYNDVFTRNVLVSRVDMLQYLDEVFSEESICNNRDEIYKIISGHYGSTYSKDSVYLEKLKELCNSDEVFSKFIISLKMFYVSSPEDEPLVVSDAVLVYIKDYIEDYITGSILSTLPMDSKVIYHSELYMYFSVRKGTDMSKYSKVKGLEVLSR